MCLQLSFSQDSYTICVEREEFGALNGALIQLRCAAHLGNTLLVRASQHNLGVLCIGPRCRDRSGAAPSKNIPVAGCGIGEWQAAAAAHLLRARVAALVRLLQQPDQLDAQVGGSLLVHCHLAGPDPV